METSNRKPVPAGQDYLDPLLRSSQGAYGLHLQPRCQPSCVPTGVWLPFPGPLRLLGSIFPGGPIIKSPIFLLAADCRLLLDPRGEPRSLSHAPPSISQYSAYFFQATRRGLDKEGALDNII